jgi:hypothetical protein
MCLCLRFMSSDGRQLSRDAPDGLRGTWLTLQTWITDPGN